MTSTPEPTYGYLVLDTDGLAYRTSFPHWVCAQDGKVFETEAEAETAKRTMGRNGIQARVVENI